MLQPYTESATAFSDIYNLLVILNYHSNKTILSAKGSIVQ